jgi:hypothetical protein
MARMGSEQEDYCVKKPTLRCSVCVHSGCTDEVQVLSIRSEVYQILVREITKKSLP